MVSLSIIKVLMGMVLRYFKVYSRVDEMATITLYKDKLNGVGSLIDTIRYPRLITLICS